LCFDELAGITLEIVSLRKGKFFHLMLRNTAINTAKLFCVVFFVVGLRFGPKKDGLAVLMFGNEMVSSVLGDIWGRVHPRRFTFEPAL